MGERFSEGGSLTGNVLFGVDIALSSHFGMQIIRKNTNYLGVLPISFTDRQSDEARSSWFTNIGFRVIF
jgi:aconitase A